MPLFLVENLVITSNPNSPHDNTEEKMPNFEPSFLFLPNVIFEHAILLVKFMKRVLPMPLSSRRICKATPNLLSLDAIPKSMFEGLLGEGKVVGALNKNVNQDFGIPVIDRHCMVPYGLDEGHLLSSSSCVPYTCRPEFVGIQEKPLPFIEDNRGGEGRVKEVPTYLARVIQKLCDVFPHPSFWVPFKRSPFAVEE